MRKLLTRVLLIATLAFSFLAAFAAPTTFPGVLTDSMCTKKHMMPGMSDPTCVRECVKEGAKYTLVADGKAYELKGQANALDALAGRIVKVTGTRAGSVIEVIAVSAAQE